MRVEGGYARPTMPLTACFRSRVNPPQVALRFEGTDLPMARLFVTGCCRRARPVAPGNPPGTGLASKHGAGHRTEWAPFARRSALGRIRSTSVARVRQQPRTSFANSACTHSRSRHWSLLEALS
jgi:hypothetical protein